jgi:hypothetical protein
MRGKIVLVLLAFVGLFIFCALVVNISVWIMYRGVEQRFEESTSSLIDSYTAYDEKLQETIQDLEAENADLRNRLQLSSATPRALPERPQTVLVEDKSNLGLLVFISILLIIIVGILSFVIPFIAARLKEQEWKEKIESIQKKAHQEGFSGAAKKLVEDTEVLSNLLEWLWWYEQGKASAKDAATLQRELLTRLISVYHLVPIGEIGQVAAFDPQKQETGEKGIRAGDQVVIKRPGWRIDGQLVRSPIVSKEVG